MKTNQPHPKIAKAYQKVMRNDMVIGLAMLVPTIYIVYAVFNWRTVWQSVNLLAIFWVALVLVAINIIAELANWRCPHCHIFLGMVFNPKFCPKCGVQLRN